ncbi:AsnC family transcriptional regulator [Fimbriimonas ginsengisoli Gsoil 348]|uniref:AsnC family transcriptional regulator n=2 Tax=Fimbriimonas ginsengisoli TaxID=1005039 RepID=A0A068NPZ6_FIMGI|nr:AsnC family transcriptional regulator [Fimbriimonas ginsengisoli Gsoil 348]
MLIVHLMQHKWDAKAPYPGFETLAKRMGMTSTAVRNHARSLEKKGYLKREPRVSQTNRFHLDGLFRKLEAYIEAHPPKQKRSEFKLDLSAFE